VTTRHQPYWKQASLGQNHH